MLRSFVLSFGLATGLALCAGAARADDLVQRDLSAFLAFSQVRGLAVEEAIQRRDRGEARALATRLHQEECRFLERVARYLRAQKAGPVADDVEGFLASYREIPLAETVRLRRQAPGGSHVHGLALAALGGKPPAAPAAPATSTPAAPAAPAVTYAPAPTALRRAYSAPRVLADVNDDFDRPRRGSGSRAVPPSSGSSAIDIPAAAAIEDSALASGIRVPRK